MINIVIFGIGKTYEKGKKFFEDNKDTICIVGFLDNNRLYQGKKIDGIMVYNPEEIKELTYDGIVILSKKYMEEMIEQLSNIGIEQGNIWNLKTLEITALRGKKKLYGNKKCICMPNKEKILIISTDMGFSGGTLVAMYAAQVLQDRGHEVMLAAPSINEKLLDEIVQKGLEITIWYCLPYIFEEDQEWICRFDLVIVNVFQMMNCAYEISKIRPVLWWIHESRSNWVTYYPDTQKEFKNIDTSDWMNRLEVLGVSKIAKEAFNFFYPSIIKRVLPFGIPDMYVKQNEEKFSKDKMIFAVTAGFSMLKGQKVLVEAMKKLTKEDNELIEVWFIGPSGISQQMLEELCKELGNVRFLGWMPHEDIIKKLPEIDVLVCPSLIETMSMSTVEGMMFEKICIATDMTGVAEYIKNGKNGFVVRANDSDELKSCISWIINNREKWRAIKKEARSTFEKEFTLEKFGDRLEAELSRCKEKFYENIINVSATVS